MSTPITVTETTFQQTVLDAELPVLVDFWAEWCGPCKALAPVLEKLAAEFADRLVIAKVDVDQEQQLAGMAGIRSLPTMMLFVDGRPVDQIVGAQPEANIRAVLERYVSADAPAISDEASPTVEDGSGEASLAQLEAILAEHPDNVDAIVAIAKIHVMAGRLDDAREMLARTPEDAADNDAVKQASAALWFADEAGALAEGTDTGTAATYRAGIEAAIGGDHDTAAERLLDVLATDRNYAEDAGRKALLQLVDLLTPADERVGQLRRRMMTLIY